MKSMIRLLASLLLLSAHAAAQAQSTDVVAEGFDTPWAMAALPGGAWLVTERGGAMRVVPAGAKRPGGPLQGVPAVEAVGQGGLLDVVLDSRFANNRQIYFCFTEKGEGADRGKNGTALARARLNAAQTALEEVQVIFRQHPKMSGRHHYGCRIAEMRDGTLAMTLGERFSGKDGAQTLDNHLGKIVRVDKSGKAPTDNPFLKTTGSLPEIYSIGHRNPQGLVVDSRGQLLAHEHGPQGGDELNLVKAGRNHGWPVITHGRNYVSGTKIGEGETRADIEPALHQWTPSIAPSGLAELSSDVYGADWKGSLFVGALKARTLFRLPFDGSRLTGAPQALLADVGRLRDVRQGPDGYLYLLIEDSGHILRVKP
ncbi:PQQ-dependent sugar dehydrogenase [Inhella sp.]|uniref:PQQ-dependent sugar dehydrogenase n=1 Tax=Inhella sp. TaxID=1921806 RepID=UPI0035AF805D